MIGMTKSLALLVLLLSAHASAKTLITAMNGSDSPTCGAKSAPCRSLSRAIANAVDGDTIIAGPGLYGDVNGDGNFDDPGDEAAEIGSGCECMVKVDKRVTLKSRDGSNATSINAKGLTNTALAVVAGGGGATIGGTQNGFTVRSADGVGIFLDQTAPGVKLVGNVAQENGGDGISVVSMGARLTGNRAFRNDGDGISILNSGVVVTGSVSSRNGEDGFLVIESDAVRIEKSIATGNLIGFAAAAATFELKSVSVLGNVQMGIYMTDGSGAINGSTIMGNGAGAANCGLSIDTTGDLDATGNYWGAATGPGSDPADDVCFTAGNLTVEPFKKSESKVVPKALR
jgi:parallel beta helix pectate lyase-like protein